MTAQYVPRFRRSLTPITEYSTPGSIGTISLPPDDNAHTREWVDTTPHNPIDEDEDQEQEQTQESWCSEETIRVTEFVAGPSSSQPSGRYDQTLPSPILTFSSTPRRGLLPPLRRKRSIPQTPFRSTSLPDLHDLSSASLIRSTELPSATIERPPERKSQPRGESRVGHSEEERQEMLVAEAVDFLSQPLGSLLLQRANTIASGSPHSPTRHTQHTSPSQTTTPAPSVAITKPRRKLSKLKLQDKDTSSSPRNNQNDFSANTDLVEYLHDTPALSSPSPSPSYLRHSRSTSDTDSLSSPRHHRQHGHHHPRNIELQASQLDDILETLQRISNTLRSEAIRLRNATSLDNSFPPSSQDTPPSSTSPRSSSPQSKLLHPSSLSPPTRHHLFLRDHYIPITLTHKQKVQQRDPKYRKFPEIRLPRGLSRATTISHKPHSFSDSYENDHTPPSSQSDDHTHSTNHQDQRQGYTEQQISPLYPPYPYPENMGHHRSQLNNSEYNIASNMDYPEDEVTTTGRVGEMRRTRKLSKSKTLRGDGLSRSKESGKAQVAAHIRNEESVVTGDAKVEASERFRIVRHHQDQEVRVSQENVGDPKLKRERSKRWKIWSRH